jgi:quercetin dioxygenase-like cupin family protein
MKLQPFVVTPVDHAPALSVLGVKVIVLASNSATGSHEITFQEGAAETGPPPHSHDWDESFYVLNGEIEFNCGGTITRCPAGTLVHVPAGVVHGFRFVVGGQMLEFTGQGGSATKMFAAVHNEIPAGPPDFIKVLAVLKQNGVTIAN